MPSKKTASITDIYFKNEKGDATLGDNYRTFFTQIRYKINAPFQLSEGKI